MGTRFHFILYEQVKKKLKYLLDICNEAQCPISNTFPLTFPMEHALLQINKKGCAHLRKMYKKVVEFDINDWKQMQNDTEMSRQFNINYAPYEAEKIIIQVYTSSTVPHARDLQISIFRNNVLTRKNLYSKKLIQNSDCRFCPTGTVEDLHHRLVSCRTCKPIWDIVNLILTSSDLLPVYDREIYLTDYEAGINAVQNQIIMYTRWFIDQAKMNEDRPNIFSLPTALFNVLDSQYNTLSATTINKAQFEKVLINIYELCIKR